MPWGQIRICEIKVYKVHVCEPFPVAHQHMDMMHEVQEEHRQLHDEVGVIDVCSLSLPGPWMVQVPEMNEITGGHMQNSIRPWNIGDI